MFSTYLLLGGAFILQTLPCDGVHHSRRENTVISKPTRPLEWGDINILHTTDTHGWLAGHMKETPPEPNYSGDLGMFASFVEHMKDEAERRGVDLLLVDSGDLHDGNGITDGFGPGGVDGHEALEFLSRLPYDVMAIGKCVYIYGDAFASLDTQGYVSHELYKYEVAYDMYKSFAPKLNGRYLTSNVNITVRENGQTTNTPLGERFAKFKTRLGRKVTAFGVLFHFQLNSQNTTIQSPADMIQESWFEEAIMEEPDVFLLVGHMAVQGSTSWPVVFDAIRAVHPQTPIVIFGGHTHIRDCVQLDPRSMALESGQYMETIGWMSLKLEDDAISFNRRYLDANPVTYSYHTGKYGKEFHTKVGQGITSGIEDISNRFNLSYKFGVAPQDYFQDRVPPYTPDSLLSLFTEEVLPTALGNENPRSNIPKMFVANSGVMRSDVFKGEFTRNDQFIVSPFTNGFDYIQNISWHTAVHIVDELNRSGLPSLRGRSLVDQSEHTQVYREWMHTQWERYHAGSNGDTDLTPGYVTEDACPGQGDDVPHTPLPHYPTPPFIGSIPPAADYLDLVFISFIRNSVLQIVNDLNHGNSSNVTVEDVKPYSDLLTDEVFGVYAELKWTET